MQASERTSGDAAGPSPTTAAGRGRLAVCPACDWVMRLPGLAPGESAHCPRCERRVAAGRRDGHQAEIALSVACLILLAMALPFDFLGFETRGADRDIVLLDTAAALFDYRYVFLGALVAATTVVLPALYLSIALYLSAGLALDRPLPWAHLLGHVLQPIRPWLMSDVFVVGVLVSLVKIVSLAEVRLGPSFLAFGAYAVLFLQTLTLFERRRFWERFGEGGGLPPALTPGRPAAAQGLRACASCEHPAPADGRCPQCGRRHAGVGFDRIEATWALLLAAAILYVPANVYPIMRTDWLGDSRPSTIVGGVLQLVESGSWPVAAVIFTASIVVPIGKIVALAWLCLCARSHQPRGRRSNMRLYRLTEIIGRWSMIDVFVVAVLAALVQSGHIVSVHPGPAAAAFAAVVILTMIAAMTFDARLIWEPDDGRRRRVAA